MSIPEGMMEVWTIERPTGQGRGVLIEDMKTTEAEADAEIARRGWPWRSVRLVVPYNDPEAKP